MGFLLTSFSKYMPAPAAVVVSSVAFGAAHLSQRDFPQPVALGVLLGFSYVRSKNLDTPMLIWRVEWHSIGSPVTAGGLRHGCEASHSQELSIPWNLRYFGW